jgi:3-oxoacyl-(acyl-carrier-protein) synthase
MSSTKSAIGHLLGAAGAVEAVATIETLRTRIVPPTLGYEVPDPACDLDYVPGEARRLSPNGHQLAAISNSFAFGGHNVTLVIKGPPE